jgi:Zn-dependent protease
MFILFMGIFNGPIWFLMLPSLYMIVTLHEFGHVFAAMYYGNKCTSVTLLPIGGVAALDAKSLTGGKKEFFVALAGPAVNFALAALCVILYAIAAFLGPWTVVEDALGWLILVNMLIGTFNLVPIFPLDGGRIVRGAITWNNRRLSFLSPVTTWIVRFSWLCSGILATYAILNGQFMLILISIFIAGQGWAEATALSNKLKNGR